MDGSVIETAKLVGVGTAAMGFGTLLGVGLAAIGGLVLAVVVVIKLGAWMVGGIAARGAIGRAGGSLGMYAAKSKINQAIWSSGKNKGQ